MHGRTKHMGGSRKNFRGGESNIVGIKVAQFNVLLAKNFIGDIPNTSIVS